MGESGDDVVYYGIYVPSKTDTVQCLVVSDKDELNAILKSNKTARFKQFATEREAREFTSNIVATGECPSSQPVYESSPFRSLSPQEMVELRKTIERHDIDRVKVLVNENPRYLVSSGDTPSILQVGSRYNALHIVARYNCPEVCSFILQCISSVSFMSRLYSGSNSDIHERCRILLDLYLNTPDKGVNETPLHFASKYGALEVVKILVSYDQCDKERLNKYGKTAKDLVCTRPSGLIEGPVEKYKEAIIKALDQRYYVGVLRSPDSCVQPTVVEPFTLRAKAEIEKSQDPLSTPGRVSGMAGPMTFEEATVFRKKWKTPPRKLNFGPSLVRSSVFDPEKGMERIGQVLASEKQIPWKEYWPFLDAFADFTSDEGLSLLEKYLDDKVKLKLSQEVHESDSTISNFERSNCEEIFTDAVETFSDPLFLATAEGQTARDSIRNLSDIPTSGGPDHVLSPISSLCQDFSSVLSITENKPQEWLGNLESKTDPFFIPLFSFNNICTVWAAKIGQALPKGASAVLRQVTNFQNYLASCAGDHRFKRSPFSKAHAYVGKTIREKFPNLKVGNGVLGKALTDVEGSDTDENLRIPTLCILKFINSESDTLDSCTCRLEPKTLRNRRLDFGSDDDTDDSDVDYFTPPSSPPNEQSSKVDEIEVTSSSPPQVPLPAVYLVGDEPTKIDRSVLEAIATVQIDSSVYPRIHAWKTLCEKSGAVAERDVWQSPDREIIVERALNHSKRHATQSWHRNLFGLCSNNPTNL